ncbi:hypothetical protein ACX0G9_24790 [Flavitalea flava]
MAAPVINRPKHLFGNLARSEFALPLKAGKMEYQEIPGTTRVAWR